MMIRSKLFLLRGLSALSAFLFIRYVNRVSAINVQSTILAYADDFKMTSIILISDFNKAKKCFYDNNLPINESETKYTIFQWRKRKR